MTILQDTSSLQQQLAALQAQNAELKAKIAARNNRAISMKVTEKGGVSVYGLGRFPVTLYLSQWNKLIAAVPDIEAFLIDNVDNLSTKD